MKSLSIRKVYFSFYVREDVGSNDMADLPLSGNDDLDVKLYFLN